MTRDPLYIERGGVYSDKAYILETIYDHNLHDIDAKNTFRFRIFLFIIRCRLTILEVM